MRLLCSQDNHRLPGSSHTAAKSRNALQELVDDDRKWQAASIRETLGASHDFYSQGSETDCDSSHLRSLEREAGTTHNSGSDGRHGGQSRLSQRRNVDLLVATQRQSLAGGGASVFSGDKVTSSTVVLSRKLPTGDLGEWSRWPSGGSQSLPVKPQSDGGWVERALLHPVAAMRALSMGFKTLAEEVQRDTTSIDGQKDAQTQRWVECQHSSLPRHDVWPWLQQQV